MYVCIYIYVYCIYLSPPAALYRSSPSDSSWLLPNRQLTTPLIQRSSPFMWRGSTFTNTIFHYKIFKPLSHGPAGIDPPAVVVRTQCHGRHPLDRAWNAHGTHTTAFLVSPFNSARLLAHTTPNSPLHHHRKFNLAQAFPGASDHRTPTMASYPRNGFIYFYFCTLSMNFISNI